MQIKRDCDYALRLIVEIGRRGNDGEWLLLSELCKVAEVPRTIGLRLCRKMKEKDLIDILKNPKTDMRCRKNELTMGASLFDIIGIFEGTGNVFTVFKRDSILYEQCGTLFEKTEGDIAELLKAMTVEKMVNSDISE